MRWVCSSEAEKESYEPLKAENMGWNRVENKEAVICLILAKPVSRLDACPKKVPREHLLC